MMASPVPPRPTVADSVGTPPAQLTHPAPKSLTPSVIATNGFRPSMPPKNSRVPAEDIDRLSSAKINTQLNGKATSIGAPGSSMGSAQSFPPPPTPPIRIISNAQARTARKSAPSSSTRGDGYSTSSSGGGGKRTIPSATKLNKEKRGGGPLAIDGTAVTPAVGNESSMFMAQPPPPAPPKPQSQPQMQNLQNPVTQPPENIPRPQQPKFMSPVIPAPPSFAGPPAQAVNPKRPASPGLSTSNFVQMKSKRQKTATPKANALVNEPKISIDGSTVKKRTRRRNGAGGSGIEKEKAGKGKGKGKEKYSGQNVFVAIMGERFGTGETLAGPRVPDPPLRLPNPPPPYQVPPQFQKANLQGKLGKKDPHMSQTAASESTINGIRRTLQGSITVPTPSEVPPATQTTRFVHSKTPTLHQQISDDVITISSSPSPTKLQATTPNGTEKQQDNNVLQKIDEVGRHQSTPITIDDGCSDGGETSDSTKSLRENVSRGVQLLEVKGNEARAVDVSEYNHGTLEPTQVSDEFFAKCIDPSTSNDERVKILVKIENFIMKLVADAKKHPGTRNASPNLEVGFYLLKQKNSTTLGKIISLLQHMGVLIEGGKIITLNEWRSSGMPKFRGNVVLSGYQKAAGEAQNIGQYDDNTALGRESQHLTISGDGSGSSVDIGGDRDKGTRSGYPVEELPNPKSSNASGISLGEKIQESSTNDKPEENLLRASEALRPVRAASQPPQPQKNRSLEISTDPAVKRIAQALQQPGNKPSSPSNQIQAEADASVSNPMPIAAIFQAPAPSKTSGKGKRKTFGPPSVRDFLNESITGQDMRSPRISSSNQLEQENDALVARIIELNQAELRIVEEIESLGVKSRLEEIELKRRIGNARTGGKATVSGTEFDSEFCRAGELVDSPVNWHEYRKATKELRDFQEDTRLEELRLAEKATRVVEEKQYLMERRKRIRHMESDSDSTTGATSSEDQSLDNRSSTAPTSAPSSISGSCSTARQKRFPPGNVVAGVSHPEMSVGHELLRALIPWATQLGETGPGVVQLQETLSVESSLQETRTMAAAAEDAAPPKPGAQQTKSKKKITRKRRQW